MPEINFDVVAVGHTTYELLAHVDRYPGAGDGIYASKPLWTGGGMTGNLVHAIARLGGRPALACAVGDDVIADQVIGQLRDVGVNVEYVLRRPGAATQITILMITPDLKRAGLITDLPGDRRLRPEEIPDAWLTAGRVFFTDMDPPGTAIMLAQRARDLGVPVAFDMQLAQDHINLPGHTENVARMVALTDYFFADEENFLMWCRADHLASALQRFMTAHPQMTILVARGPAGAVLAHHGETWAIPAFSVRVVDSIGAGDALHGAFLYAHLGLAWPLVESARYGTAAAALSCTRAGARDGLPTHSDVLTLLAAHGYA